MGHPGSFLGRMKKSAQALAGFGSVVYGTELKPCPSRAEFSRRLKSRTVMERPNQPPHALLPWR
jgi:hypothetical protein